MTLLKKQLTLTSYLLILLATCIPTHGANAAQIQPNLVIVTLDGVR